MKFNSNRALEIGKAAEHLVCCDLILSGYKAFLSDQGMPYDVVVDHAGKLMRVQVKSCFKIRNMNPRNKSERIGYSFSARRMGKGGYKKLDASMCDIVAFVTLDTKIIAYLPIGAVSTTMQFRSPGFVSRGKYRSKFLPIDQYPISLLIGEPT